MATAEVYCPRCAAKNLVGSAHCSSCGNKLPGFAAPPSAQSAQSYAPQPFGELSDKLAIERAKVKEPILGGILGFVIPAVGAFYNGKIGWGLAFILIEVPALLSVIVTAGTAQFLWHVVGGYLGYKWAKDTNLDAMERLVTRRVA